MFSSLHTYFRVVIALSRQSWQTVELSWKYRLSIDCCTVVYGFYHRSSVSVVLPFYHHLDLVPVRPMVLLSDRLAVLMFQFSVFSSVYSAVLTTGFLMFVFWYSSGKLYICFQHVRCYSPRHGVLIGYTEVSSTQASLERMPNFLIMICSLKHS